MARLEFGNAGLTLLIQPDDVSITVRVELVETLRQAQGERFIVHKAESIVVARAVCQRFNDGATNGAGTGLTLLHQIF